ncbi:hypothetical protein [Nocardia blacklockiae]|uniref:hypothetical protein n=1 Tax=Nocardia blacklockiae TaxID=480036 RepID=UPI002B4AC487|nr:hypothetical protein [Nocardia blacklockiae]
MSQLIKVYTPVKRVPTMVGKAQNGQKLPFGPYTLPQVVGGVVLMLITSVFAMTLPLNPAVTFIAGTIVTIAAVFGLGLVPYTGVRTTSRILWVGRLILVRKPVSAAGMPVTEESARHTMFIEESIVVILPDREQITAAAAGPAPVSVLEPAQSIVDRWSAVSKRMTTVNGNGVAAEGRG